MKTPSTAISARLLEAAPELLRPDGVPRFEEVADVVGVSRATLYYYFSGQDDLLAFLLAAHVEEGASAIAEADPGTGSVQQRLRAVLTRVLEYLGARPTVCSGLLSAAASGGDLRQVLTRNEAHIARPIRELLQAGAVQGELGVPDPADATNAILGAALMAVLGRAATGGDTAAADFREAVVEQLVRGVMPAGVSPG